MDWFLYNIDLHHESVKQNYRGTKDKFVASDNAISFMNQINGTPAYWK